jgi:hypothetical protein
VRNALATLPWVEQETIHIDVKAREVSFNLKEGSQFNEAEAKQALKKEGMGEAQVKTGRS